MNARHLIRIVLSFSLLLAACATTAPPNGAAPPVKVVVTSDPGLGFYVSAEQFTEATEKALRQYASNAAPSTVTVHFMNSTDKRQNDVRSDPDPVVLQQSVPIVSGPKVQAVKANYVIADQSGKVLEERTLAIGIDYPAGPGDRLHDQLRRNAEYLAKRVAELTGKLQS